MSNAIAMNPNLFMCLVVGLFRSNVMKCHTVGMWIYNIIRCYSQIELEICWFLSWACAVYCVSWKRLIDITFIYVCERVRAVVIEAHYTYNWNGNRLQEIQLNLFSLKYSCKNVLYFVHTYSFQSTYFSLCYCKFDGRGILRRNHFKIVHLNGRWNFIRNFK